jgi:CRP-like cAMP-binding protein
MEIDQIINNIFPLPELSKFNLTQHISEISHPKGFCLMEANKVVPYIYFLKKGIVRAYASTENNDM